MAQIEQPTLCAVCRRHAQALAYLPKSNSQPLWLCDDNDCHRLAKEVAKMPHDVLDTLERAAALEAGAQAGDYLDSQGCTDLAQLSQQQWEEFLRRIVVGYEKELRRRVDDTIPF